MSCHWVKCPFLTRTYRTLAFSLYCDGTVKRHRTWVGERDGDECHSPLNCHHAHNLNIDWEPAFLLPLDLILAIVKPFLLTQSVNYFQESQFLQPNGPVSGVQQYTQYHKWSERGMCCWGFQALIILVLCSPSVLYLSVNKRPKTVLRNTFLKCFNVTCNVYIWQKFRQLCYTMSQ